MELLPDAELDAAVRADWDRLRRAGLPSLAAHPHPSNRPHLTLVTAARLHDLPALPLPITVLLGAPALLGRALVRPVAAGPDLRDLQAAVWRAAEQGWPPPGEWVPHVSLALRAAPGAPAALAGLPALPGRLVSARRYDTRTREVTVL